MRKYRWVKLLRGRIWHHIKEEGIRAVKTDCGVEEGIGGQEFCVSLNAGSPTCPRCMLAISRSNSIMEVNSHTEDQS